METVDEGEVPAAPAPRPAPKQGGGGYRKGGGQRDQYWEDKAKRDIEVVEPRITWASATSDAVKIVTAALQHDLLAFGNANKSAKLGMLLDYVDQVTAKLAVDRFDAANKLNQAIKLQGKAKAAASTTDADEGLE